MDNEEKLLLEGEEKKEEEQPTELPEPTGTSPEETDATAEVAEEADSAALAPIVEEDGATETSIKTFTQDDVDKLVGDTRVKTREKTFNYIYNRYGVKNEEEMDALVANAQRYDTLKDEYDERNAAWDKEKSDTESRLNDMSSQIALMQSGIEPDRFEDVKLILTGKGLEINAENIAEQLLSHPEWKKVAATEETDSSVTSTAPAPAEEKTVRIKTLGNEKRTAPVLSEEEQAEKIFKMKFH